ncbi:MAG TPA: HAD family hydrolase [Pyrinomonadaceae bacterium]|nr:HAD family hydrolase [Pyrinomonadaceae bacterium]
MLASLPFINTLLFDWDGTLNDSSAAGFVAFQKSLEGFDVQFDREFYDRHYTPNWYAMYEIMGLPREEWERADSLWVQHYAVEESPMVEGARETIVELHNKDYRLGIVSSGNHSRILDELKKQELDSLFPVLICHEQTTNKKPHPEGLECAMRELNAAPHVCAYVGDVPEDIEMGRRAHVLTVGVRSQFPSSKNLPQARPDIYLDSITELLLHF